MIRKFADYFGVDTTVLAINFDIGYVFQDWLFASLRFSG
jgi:hypothetical protein